MQLRNTVTHKRLSILFTSSWYPSKAHFTVGNFVQRHAEAVATLCDVWVLYVASMPQWQGPPRIEEHREKNVNTVVVYCKHGFFAKRKAFVKGAYHLMRSKNLHFDAAHHNVLWPHGWQARWLKNKFKLPYIVTEHWTGYDLSLSRKRHPLLRWMSQFGTSGASYICPVTSDLQQKMEAFGIHGLYKVVPNVVDTSIFQLRTPSLGAVRFIHVSSLVDAHKNISGMLRAWKKATDENPQMHLSLGGDGPINHWKNEAEKLQIPRHTIDFFGEIPWHEVAEKMKNSDTLVLFSNYENLPCVIVEALACGLSIISTRVGGISEHITPERGILVAPADEEALSEALLSMAQTHGEYKPTTLRAYSVQHFGEQSIAEQFQAIYLKAINE